MKDNCRTWFTCTGTDAVDDALRLTRQYFIAKGKRSKTIFISRWQGFHGNNLAVTGMHGHTGRRRMFMGMNIGSPHIPPAYCYRCPYEMTLPGLPPEVRPGPRDRDHASRARRTWRPSSPSRWWGRPWARCPRPEGYFQVIREICDKYDVLFIADEVMTAWGRIGHWFGIEEWGVTPDIIATAKGMASGYATLAATIAREEIWGAVEATGAPYLRRAHHGPQPGGLRRGARGHPVRRRERPGEEQPRDGRLPARASGGAVRHRHRRRRARHGPHVRVRARAGQGTKEPFDPALRVSARVQDEAFARGLILFSCTGCVDGVAGDMMLVTPPLTITRAQVDELVAITKDAVEAVRAEVM